MDELHEKFSTEAGLSVEEVATQLNLDRFQAWRTVLLALGSCAIVAVVFITTETWIWTGGLLLAGSWVFRSGMALREANAQLVAHEHSTGIALKAPLPTWIKVSAILALPITLILGVQALNAYDPSILASASGQPFLDDPASYSPTDSEGESSGFQWYAGARVVLPEVCNVLTLQWHTENRNNDVISNYTNTFNQGLIMNSSNSLIFGTDYDVSDAEVFFIPDSVSCD